MNNTVSFPNLFEGDVEIHRVAFRIFGMDIYWYGVLITFGVTLAVLYGLSRAKSFGLIADKLFDTVFVGGIAGIIGARAYYVIFTNLNDAIHYNYTLKEAVFSIRDGGLAIYGGIIFSILTAVIYSAICKNRILPTLDLAGLGFLIGQSVGRWGNFVNQEAFGAPTAGHLPWGMTGNFIEQNQYVMLQQAAMPQGELALVHPCFLYESLWCALIFAVLHFYSKKLQTFDGEIFLLYATCYGAERAFVESLRLDSLYAGEYRVSQAVAIITAAVSIVIFIICKIRTGKNPQYLMARNDSKCIAKIESYITDMKIKKEKKAAVKALRKAQKEKIAPSIFEDSEGDNNG